MNNWLTGPIAFVALGLFLIGTSFFVGADYATRNQVGGAVHNKLTSPDTYAVDSVLRSCSDATRDDFVKCAAEAIEESSEYVVAEYSVTIQERMMHYAFWALILTGAGSMVGGIGIFFVAKTLHATERGIRDTHRSYIHVTRCELKWGDKYGSRPSITLEASNSGQTPAIWHEVRCLCLIQPSEDFDFDISISRKDLSEVGGTRWQGFAAGGILSMPGIYRKDDYEDLKKSFNENDMMINVFGSITYKTFFGEVFVSEFTFQGYVTNIYDEISKEVREIVRQDSGIPINFVRTEERGWRIPQGPANGLLLFHRIS